MRQLRRTVKAYAVLAPSGIVGGILLYQGHRVLAITIGLATALIEAIVWAKVPSYKRWKEQ